MPRAGAVPARFKSAERSVSVEPSYINHDTHTPSGSPMSSLPLELWWNILDSLDNNSLSAYCQACRAWYSIGNLTLWGRIEKLSELSSRLVSKKALLSIDGILRPPSSPETTNFNQLDIDWSSELSRLIYLTQHTTHLLMDNCDIPEIFYLLKRHQPQVIALAFPGLRTLSIDAGSLHCADVQWFISCPTLARIKVTLPGSSISRWFREEGVRRVKLWRPSCPASLKSLSLLLSNSRIRSIAIIQLLEVRKWESLELPSIYLRPTVLSALASMNALKSLTLAGKWSSWKYSERDIDLFQIMSVTDVLLVLDEEYDGSTNCQLIKTVALTCPNVERFDIMFKNISTNTTIPIAYFTNLFVAPSLTHLTFRPSRFCRTRLADRFLCDAARAWKRLHTLDLAPQLMRTQITLRALAAFGRADSQLQLAHHPEPSFGAIYQSVPLRIFRVHLGTKHQLYRTLPSLDMQLNKARQKFRDQISHTGDLDSHGEQTVALLKALFPGLEVVETTRRPHDQWVGAIHQERRWGLKLTLDWLKEPTNTHFWLNPGVFLSFSYVQFLDLVKMWMLIWVMTLIILYIYYACT